MLSKSIFLGLLVIVFAYLYTKWKECLAENQEESIILFWNSSIREPTDQFSHIAVGINCNLDLIVSGVALLSSLEKGRGQPLDSVALESIDDLANTFTYYFSKGSAAERTFKSKEIYAAIIETAEKLEEKEHYIGGNAALMAVNIAELFPNKKIQLIGPIGPVLKKLLPHNVLVPDDSLIDKDEVHLIMEYGLHEAWQGLESPVANRFITSYDESNSRLTMLNKFFKDLGPFSPNLVLVSGLHLLETQSLTYMSDKLEEFKTGLQNIPQSIPVHLELASMADEGAVKLIIDEVSSLGLNEQELTFSSYVANGPHSSYYHSRNGQPEIYKISDMVLWLLKTYGYSSKNPRSRLTRVHFHSLTYHIIGSLPDAWLNSESAVGAGTRMAGRQACKVDRLSPPDIELRIPQSFQLFSGSDAVTFNESKPVVSWKREGFQFVFSPVLVCINPLKTVGLGDAISA
ncbi:ADPGK-like protein, partial [Mya arenaria]